MTTGSTRWAAGAATASWRSRWCARGWRRTRPRRSASSVSCSACRWRWSGNGRDVLDDGPLRRARGVRRAPGGVRRTAVAVPDVGVAGAAGRARARVGCRRRRRDHGTTRGRSRARRPPVQAGDLPLNGVTVLDLTAFWAGPAATHHLATLGADVLKIESPTRPDGMRFATVKPPDDPDWMEFGPTFHGTNPAKRSVTIDFSTAGGPRARPAAGRARRRRGRELHAPGAGQRRRSSTTTSSRATPASSCCACPRSGSTVRGATAAASRRPPSRCRGSRG